MLSSYGTLIIRTYSADALALSDAEVHITGAEEDNRFIAYSLISDIDGVTPEVQLPAPDRALSQSPSAENSPYSVYDIVVEREGYYTRRIYGVSIFPDVKSLLIVNMIPLGNEGVDEYPKGNINVTIPRNYRLEN